MLPHPVAVPEPPTAAPIRVGLVAPPSIVRAGLEAVLRAEARFEVRVSDDPRAPATKLRGLDVLIVDGTEQEWSTAVGAAERAGVPPQKALVVCKVGTAEEAAELLALDVAGCVLVEERPEALVEKVRAVARGDWRAGRRDLLLLLSQGTQNGAALAQLSPREREVLSLIAGGFSNPRIAEELSLSEGRVRNLASALYQKLGVQSRSEAVRWALRRGIGARQ